MPVIEIDDLHRRFGRREVVRGLSLRVEAGEIYGLLGPNGSGKTTTLSCALGLLRPTRGTAHILGEPAGRIHRLAGRLGVVFDSAIALPVETARGNLVYLRKLLGHSRGRSVVEVLDLVGLSEMAKTRARALSLGQRRRLAIAGALLGEPELLILDEPLSGLDTMGVRGMLRLFRTLAGEGLTLLLSSHRLHEMQTVITHAGILFEGRIARGGSLGELLGQGSGRFALLVSEGARAEAVAGRVDGVEWLSREEQSSGWHEHLVKVDSSEIERLNRALLEGGCEVRTVEPRVETLQSVFESIVDGKPREEVRS